MVIVGVKWKDLTNVNIKVKAQCLLVHMYNQALEVHLYVVSTISRMKTPGSALKESQKLFKKIK